MLGESLTSEYLASEAKVESARSHALSLEAENSKLKKELIVAMNDANLAKEKLRTLTEKFRVERDLTKEKNEQLVAARRGPKVLQPRLSRASSRSRSTILYFLAGTSRDLSF